MTKKVRIIITGAAGTIGGVLMKYLSRKYEVIGVDKKQAPDVLKLDLLKNAQKFKKIIAGAEVIIHLAWDTRENTAHLEPVVDANKKMGELVYRLALEEKIPRVIFASSVHAAMGFIKHPYPEFTTNCKFHKSLHNIKIFVEDGFFPLGVYGASKVYLEALGRAYSARGLEVIAVRFGNVTPDNGHGEYPFWLSHRDCCQFIEKCCLNKNLPPFSTFFAISDNACNPFDIFQARQLLGYRPQDSSTCPLKYH